MPQFANSLYNPVANILCLHSRGEHAGSLPRTPLSASHVPAISLVRRSDLRWLQTLLRPTPPPPPPCPITSCHTQQPPAQAAASAAGGTGGAAGVLPRLCQEASGEGLVRDEALWPNGGWLEVAVTVMDWGLGVDEEGFPGAQDHQQEEGMAREALLECHTAVGAEQLQQQPLAEGVSDGAGGQAACNSEGPHPAPAAAMGLDAAAATTAGVAVDDAGGEHAPRSAGGVMAALNGAGADGANGSLRGGGGADDRRGVDGGEGNDGGGGGGWCSAYASGPAVPRAFLDFPSGVPGLQFGKRQHEVVRNACSGGVGCGEVSDGIDADVAAVAAAGVALDCAEFRLGGFNIVGLRLLCECD